MREKAVWNPSQELIESTRLFQWMQQLGFSDYESFHKASVSDVGWFWQEAERVLGIEWQTPYERPVDMSKGIKWPEWYVGGKLNVVHNAVKKWARNPETANRNAVIWEGDDGAVSRFTFAELNERVNNTAKGLKRLGVQKGDRVSLYLPMIPETVIAMLAVAKIGAVFSPAFSGYGADAVAKRLNAATAKVLITADGFLRRGKQVKMKEEADRAAADSPSVEKVVVVRRLGRDIPWQEGRDVDWNDVESTADLQAGDASLGAIAQTEEVATEWMSTTEPLMLLYTSGTTGKPKGAVHTHSGFPIKSAFDAGITMDVKAGDTLFWFTDMGWMMGPFMVFGALLNGAAALLFEGTPDFPQPDRLWKVVADHQVTHLGISPTLIRSIMKLGDNWAKQHDISTLRVIGSTGEPWNPEPWLWLFDKVGNRQIPIFNYSGGTEISGGILGNVLVRPIGPVTFNAPLPGMDADVYDHEGNPVRNEVGELVLKQPWVGMTQGFWQEPERYEEAYWSRWSDTWVHGDWVVIDDENFWTITGRSDDTLNVAGKRLGPAEIESVLVGHEAVAEAGAIGVPDEVKGEVAVCFVVLKPGVEPNAETEQALLNLLGEKLGKALRPKAVYFVQELPRTRNGKILRRVMRSAYLDKEAGDLSSLENEQAVETIRSLGKA